MSKQPSLNEAGAMIVKLTRVSDVLEEYTLSLAQMFEYACGGELPSHLNEECHRKAKQTFDGVDEQEKAEKLVAGVRAALSVLYAELGEGGRNIFRLEATADGAQPEWLDELLV